MAHLPPVTKPSSNKITSVLILAKVRWLVQKLL